MKQMKKIILVLGTIMPIMGTVYAQSSPTYPPPPTPTSCTTVCGPFMCTTSCS